MEGDIMVEDGGEDMVGIEEVIFIEGVYYM